MRYLTALFVVGLLILLGAGDVIAQSIAITAFPAYADSSGGKGEGTPFAVHVTISNWHSMAGTDVNVKVTRATTGKHFYIWNGSWKNAYKYSNCPVATIDADGNWSGWIYLRVSEATDSTFKAAARKVGASTGAINEDTTHSITYLDMATTGTWVHATAAAATANKAVLAFDENDNIIGSYTVENNHVDEGNDSTQTGYFKMAVPANATIAKLEVRNADNSVYETQTSSLWQSGAPGTDTDLDAQQDVTLPVTLITFTAVVDHDQILLKWSTESEVNTLGFEIYRSMNTPDSYQKLPVFIPGAGNSYTRKEYQYIDRDVTSGVRYYYKLAEVDFNGYRKEYGPVSAIPRSGGIDYPKRFDLEQNFPNPFNPSTKIPIDLPMGRPGTMYPTVLKILDVTGREVVTLIDKPLRPGRWVFVWDGRDSSGVLVASGVYFYLLKAGSFMAVKKMLMIR